MTGAKKDSYEDAPHFVQPLHSNVLVEGSCAAFEVVIIGEKPIEVQWLKDGQNCAENPNYEVSENDTTNHYTLTIPEVFDEDAGRYTCMAKNSIGHASSTAELVIKPVPIAPVISPNLENRQVEEGNSVEFAVEVTGTPAPIIKWYREGAEIHANADFNISEEAAGKSKLTIVKTYGEDTGNFTVSAVNVAGKATSTCHLAVLESKSLKNVNRAPVSRGPAPSTLPKPANVDLRQYESSVDSKELTVTKTESSVTALKSFKSVKAPKTKEKAAAGASSILPPWKVTESSYESSQTIVKSSTSKMTSQVISSQTIVEQSASAVAMQAISTPAQGATTATEDLESEKESETSYQVNDHAPGMMPPLFRQSLEPITSKEGDATLFIAFVEAFPAPEVKFYREGAFIEHNEDFIQSFDKNTGCCKLLIKETFIDDAGRFTLTCHNDAGTASCSAMLHVTVSPTGSQRVRSPVDIASADELSITDHELSGFETNDMEVVEVNDYVSGNETEDKGDDQYYAQTALSPVDEERTEDKSISENVEAKAELAEQVAQVAVMEQSAGGPAIFNKLAPFTKLVEGDSYSFAVSVDPSSEAHVYWMFDGKPLMSGYRVKIDSDAALGFHKLTLTMVFPEDAGEYTLFARNQFGETSTSTLFLSEEQIKQRQYDDMHAVGDALDDGAGRGRSQTTKRQDKIANYKKKSPGKSGSRDRSSSLRRNSASPSGSSRRLADLEQADIEKLYRPVFLKKPIDKEVREKGTTRIDCKVTGRPLPVVQWFKEGHNVVNDANHHIVIKEDGVNSLIIEDASAVDNGEYTIVAKNKAGKSVCSVRITVIANEELCRPKILEKPNSANIRAGEGIKLEVFASGNPSPDIIWIQGNQVIQPEKMPWFSVEGVDGHGLLTINSADRRHHDGWYTATAVNKAGRDLCRFRIAVEEEDHFEEDKPVKIKIAKSRSTSRSKTLERVSAYETGSQSTERTTSESIIKRMPTDLFDDSDLYDKANPIKPKFKTTIEAVKTKTLSGAHFDCYLVPIGDPDMKVEWKLDGKPMETANRIQPLLEFGYCALDFTSCFPRDSGVITCVATNAMGKSECSTTLIVKEQKDARYSRAEEEKHEIGRDGSGEREIEFIGQNNAQQSHGGLFKLRGSSRHRSNDKQNAVAPEITLPPESVIVEEGNPCKFTAKVQGYPAPKVMWFMQDKLVMKTKRFALYKDGLNKLEIKETKNYDTGMIKIVAENSAGRCEAMCSLDVTAKTDFRGQLKSTKVKESSKIATEMQLVAEKRAYHEAIEAIKGRPGSAMSRTMTPAPFDRATPNRSTPISNELSQKFSRLTDEERVKQAAFGDHTKHVEAKDKNMASLMKDAKDALRATPTPDALERAGSASPAPTKLIIPNLKKQDPKDVKVGGPATIREKIYDAIVTEGHAISLRVRFHGFPEPKVQWLRNGREIVNSDSEYITFPNQDICELVIKEATQAQAGMITVSVFNGHGGEQCDAVLKVKKQVPAHPDTPDVVDPNVEFSQILKDITVASGEVATLETTCTKFNAEVKWRFNGQILEMCDRIIPVSDTYKHLLIIEDVIPEDAGKYTAEVDGVTTHCELEVATPTGMTPVMPDQPHFVSEVPRQKHAYTGAKINLECVLSDYITDEGIWLYENRQIQPGNGIQMTSDGQSRHLHIESAHPEMTGVVTFMVGEAQSCCNLIVSPLEITSRVTDVNSTLNSRAVIEVEFTHEVELEGTWWKDEKEIDANNKHYEFVRVDRWQKLIIDECTKEDAGLYSYKVDAAAVEYTVELFVDDPTIPSPVQSVEEELKCMQSPLDQIPSIQIATICEEVLNVNESGEVLIEFETNDEGLYGAWFKNGEQIDEHASQNVTYVVHARRHKLLFKEVTMEDAGSYSFTVGQVTNTVSLNVERQEAPKCAPIFLQELCSCVGIQGEQIALTCRIRGEPYPIVAWWHPQGYAIESDNVKYVIQQEEDQHTLIIGNVEQADAGVYIAVAQNEVGQIQGQADVIIDAKEPEPEIQHESPPATPAPTTPSRIEIMEGLKDFKTREGSSALFTCRVSGSGFTGTWFHNNKKVIPSRFFKISEYQGLHQLEILETFPEDAGQYRFIAHGQQNEVSSAASLNLEQLFTEKKAAAEQATQVVQSQSEATQFPSPKPPTPVVSVTPDQSEQKTGGIKIKKSKNKSPLAQTPSPQPEKITLKKSKVKTPEPKPVTPEPQMPQLKKVKTPEPKPQTPEPQAHKLRPVSPRPAQPEAEQEKVQLRPVSPRPAQPEIEQEKVQLRHFEKEAEVTPVKAATPDLIRVKSPEHLVPQGVQEQVAIPEQQTYSQESTQQQVQQTTTTVVEEFSQTVQTTQTTIVEQSQPPRRQSPVPQVQSPVQKPQLEPPVFIQKLTNTKVHPGASVSFDVTFSGSAPISATWFHGNNQITNSQFQITSDNCTWARCQIPSSRYENSGNYKVKISNDAGEAECSANLQIEGAAPAFSHPSTVVGCKANSMLRLETTVTAQPRASCFWEFEGHEITGTRYKIFSEGDMQILVIDEFRASDAGKFTCVAENELGTAKWSANVRVESESDGKKGSGKSSPQKTSKKSSREASPSKKQKKKVKSDKKSPTQDKSKTSSRSDSVSSQSTLPPATPASDYVADWMDEDDLKNQKGKKKKVVKIPGAKPEEPAKKSTSKTVVPEAQEVTSDKPIFIEIPVSQECTVSENATFSCKVVGNPQPEIQWYKGKWGKLSSFGRIKVDYDKSTGISHLNISKLDKPDKGQYRAVAKNNRGEAVTTFELKISDKKSPSHERVTLKRAPAKEDDKDTKPPMELLKYVDPREYEKYATHFGVTDFRNMLVPVEYDGTENSETEYVSSFSPTESDISDFSLIDVLAEMRDTAGVIGKQATFQTELRVNMPGLDVQWYKKKDRIVESDKYQIKQRGDIHELVIKQLEPSDEGEIRVVAGPYQRSAYLDIIKEDEGKYYIPDLKYNDEELRTKKLDPVSREYFLTPLLDLHNVQVGSDVEMSCTVKNPEIDVEWYCDEQLIQPLATILESPEEDNNADDERSTDTPRLVSPLKPPIHPDSKKRFEVYKSGIIRKLAIKNVDPKADSGTNITCRAVDFKNAQTEAKLVFAPGDLGESAIVEMDPRCAFSLGPHNLTDSEFYRIIGQMSYICPRHLRNRYFEHR